MSVHELAPPKDQFEGQFAISAPAADSVFVGNVELVLNPNRVTGDHARKVLEISDRYIWYPGYQTVVVPAEIDPGFKEYVGGFGLHPEVLVPAGINKASLSVRDGFGDPVLQSAVANKVVESYVSDNSLARFVEYLGGTYVGGLPKNKPQLVNDKARFGELTGGIVSPPPGVAYHGINAIAQAVQQRLHREGQAFVRHTQSGGGFGNRAFQRKGGRMPSLEQIQQDIVAGHPKMWQDATALVEEFMEFRHFPAVNFNQGEFRYDNLGILRGSDYVGCWSPVPEYIIDPAELVKIGRHVAQSLKEKLGYHLNGNVDMGLTADNNLVGFEINGRFTASRHAIAIGELLFQQPWSQWRDAGHVIKSMDKFVLQKPMTFDELHGTLDGESLLANQKHPHGVVISIAPHGKVAGIHVQAGSYEDAEAYAREVEQLVGDARANRHDSPLLET